MSVLFLYRSDHQHVSRVRGQRNHNIVLVRFCANNIIINKYFLYEKLHIE